MFKKLLGQIGSSIGSMIGGSIGNFFGGGVFSKIASSLGAKYGGKIVGKLGLKLDRKLLYRKQNFTKISNLRDSFYFTSLEHGSAIPLIFGRMRVEGKIIWLNKITQVEETTSSTRYFDYLRYQSNVTEHKFSYRLSFAVAICEGLISEITRVWDGDELINLSKYHHRIYYGGENQQADPLISRINGGLTPAFRDLAYVVFEELPLADFGDLIPNFSFEVTRKANIANSAAVEDMITSMIMIPGSGEYVYDTIPITKTYFTGYGCKIMDEVLNIHNNRSIADAVCSLDQLQQVCKNTEWVAPVVCWFGSSLNAADCLIRPAVEHKDDNCNYSQTWNVGSYNRKNSPLVSRNDFDFSYVEIPNYGGTVNDGSVIRYLQEIKRRRLKIMFYPMFFLDIPQKPWRGRLTGSPDAVRNFFTKPQGYNEFILHYANLVKDHVDAFVIGSELIGLTKVKDTGNQFPAVIELRNLASLVKNIVGSKVKVTYAADWSEYHHTEGGWYNLDLLWSSPAIDVIGIDVYFPVTDATSSAITDEEIARGFSSGEGFDYYVDWQSGKRYPLDPKYAWKNVKYWWENHHIDPNGIQTSWIPRSKKIWFTEFGFPSIDKAPNQPNVFYDINCIDGGVPRHSNGEVNFSIQKRCIYKFIEFWKKQEYVENMFLWTWDARPYPAWPHMSIWNDSSLWEKGHWVNSKLGTSTLGGVILELSQRSNIDLSDIDVSRVDHYIEGMIINTNQTCLDILNLLKIVYFFDITANYSSKISFVARTNRKVVQVDKNDLLKVNQDSFINFTDYSPSELLGSVDLYYINNTRDFDSYYIHINNDSSDSNITEEISIPIVLSPGEAESIGNLVINSASLESRVIEFVISIDNFSLLPSTYFVIEDTKYQDFNFKLSVDKRSLDRRLKSIKGRIVSYRAVGLRIHIEAVLDDLDIYKNLYKSVSDSEKNSELTEYYKTLSKQYKSLAAPKLIILELPFFLPGEDGNNLVCYYSSSQKAALYAKIEEDEGSSLEKVSDISPSNSIGTLLDFHLNYLSMPDILDDLSWFSITDIDLSAVETDEWHIAKIGGEFIRFSKIVKSSDGNYIISNLSRGEFGTKDYILDHMAGEDFVLITNGWNLIRIKEILIGRGLNFYLTSGGTEACLLNLLNVGQFGNHMNSSMGINENHDRTSVTYNTAYLDIKHKVKFDYYVENDSELIISIDPSIYSIDSWQINSETLKATERYKIVFTNFDITQEFITSDLTYKIDISSGGLSVYHRIDIIKLL